MILILVYLLDEPRKKIYEKDTGRMFIIDSILMLVSGELYACDPKRSKAVLGGGGGEGGVCVCVFIFLMSRLCSD